VTAFRSSRSSDDIITTFSSRYTRWFLIVLVPKKKKKKKKGSAIGFMTDYTHFIFLFPTFKKQLEQSKLSVEEASEILSLKHQPSGYLPPKQDRARNKALSQGWRSIFAGKPSFPFPSDSPQNQEKVQIDPAVIHWLSPDFITPLRHLSSLLPFRWQGPQRR
jgi:hypothetical protein